MSIHRNSDRRSGSPAASCNRPFSDELSPNVAEFGKIARRAPFLIIDNLEIAGPTNYLPCTRSVSFTKLPNYLKARRKRADFSQDEISFLLGTQGGARVCRYERFTRQPTLATALAFEVIFHVPTRDLFAGVYRKVERRVANRAALLLKNAATEPRHLPAQKLQALQRIAGTETAAIQNQ